MPNNYPFRQFSPRENSAIRLPSLPRRPEIFERIMVEAIKEPLVAAYRQRAQFTFFCGAEPDQHSGYDAQLEAVGRCLEWFVYDYRIPELEATPAQHWLNGRAEGLSETERAEVFEALKFVLGLFEIMHVEANDSFLALDLLRQPQSYIVREKVVTNEIAPGQLLIGRLFPNRKSHLLSGMAAIMNSSATKQIRDYLHRGKLKPAEILRELDGLELENFFGRRLADLELECDAEEIETRLRHYLRGINPDRVSWEELESHLAESEDELSFATEVCAKFNIVCRHELDLLFALLMAWWKYRW